MDLTQQVVQRVIIWVNLRYFLQSVKVWQHWRRLIFDLLSDRLESFGRLCRHCGVTAICNLNLVIILNLLNNWGWNLLRLFSTVLIHNVCYSIVLHEAGQYRRTVIIRDAATMAWWLPAFLNLATERVQIVAPDHRLAFPLAQVLGLDLIVMAHAFFVGGLSSCVQIRCLISRVKLVVWGWYGLAEILHLLRKVFRAHSRIDEVMLLPS